MRLSLIMIGDAGDTVTSGQPKNVVNSRSSMTTFPVTFVMPAAAICCARSFTPASGSAPTSMAGRPVLA